MLPTQPNPALPIQVRIKIRSRGGTTVRPPAGGAPPSVLAVSPFKLQALRDIDFADPVEDVRGESIVVTFDLASKQLPAPSSVPKTSYETLWSQQHMKEERTHIGQMLDSARVVATSFVRGEVFEPLLESTEEMFAIHGNPLHPGEAVAIAKLLTYALSDRSDSEPKFRYEDQRWFQVLVQTLAADEKVARWMGGEIASRTLYESVIYDAVLLGFALIRPRVRTNLGDRAERIAYANKVVRWLAGQLPPDLVYIYLPLVLGGVAVNHIVTGPGDDPWGMLEDLREAYRGRVRLADSSTQEVFEMLDRLIQHGEDDLRRSRIPRE
ncbi:MAG: hypothetical protein IPK19_25565 [Chloroflexi bacterium]|nr:hypothetical protein [Chloroflexota bacterium]